ncbi:hypothetical protein CVS40_7002 [Lucilia cuprina]|nr:hypothetical protein CVS40_7002 [Lucilia cuprina]
MQSVVINSRLLNSVSINVSVISIIFFHQCKTTLNASIKTASTARNCENNFRVFFHWIKLRFSGLVIINDEKN